MTAVLMAGLAMTGLPARAASNINESNPARQFWVDAVSGNDSNDGSSAAPFKTFQKGLNTATYWCGQNQKTKLWVKPGTYRGRFAGAVFFDERKRHKITSRPTAPRWSKAG